MKAKGLSLESQPLVETGQDMPSAEREERQPSTETETKRNASRRSENNLMRGRRLSPEHRARISATLKGNKHSAEARAKMSAAKSEKNPDWRQYIEQVRWAIARVAAGQTMRAASLEAGFNERWLSVWRTRHLEEYRLISAEETSKLERKLLIRRMLRLTDELQDEGGFVSFGQLSTTLNERVNKEVHPYGDDLHLLAKMICRRKGLFLTD